MASLAGVVQVGGFVVHLLSLNRAKKSSNHSKDKRSLARIEQPTKQVMHVRREADHYGMVLVPIQALARHSTNHPSLCHLTDHPVRFSVPKIEVII